MVRIDIWKEPSGPVFRAEAEGFSTTMVHRSNPEDNNMSAVFSGVQA
jgi:hypothetical protein